VLHRARAPDPPVAAEHHQRREPVLARPIGVREAVLERVLARENRHDPVAGGVVADVRREVTEVVLLGDADGAVGEEDGGSLEGQRPHGVVGVDPRVHPGRRRQLRTGRPEFGRDEGLLRSQGLEQRAHVRL